MDGSNTSAEGTPCLRGLKRVGEGEGEEEEEEEEEERRRRKKKKK